MFRFVNQCDHPEPNQSGNPHVRDLLGKAVARRTILAAGATASAGAALAPLAGSSPAAAATGQLSFTPVAPNNRDNVTVPPGYDYDVVAKWGDRILPDAPEFDVFRQTPQAQAKQFGYNCDYVGFLPIQGKKDRAILCVNHEYTDEVLMFPEGRYSDETIMKIAMQAHGLSFLEIVKGSREGSWSRVRPEKTKYNRRISVTTHFRLTGPAAGDPRLRSEEHTSELQSLRHLVCRLLLEKKKIYPQVID